MRRAENEPTGSHGRGVAIKNCYSGNREWRRPDDVAGLIGGRLNQTERSPEMGMESVCHRLDDPFANPGASLLPGILRGITRQPNRRAEVEYDRRRNRLINVRRVD